MELKKLYMNDDIYNQIDYDGIRKHIKFPRCGFYRKKAIKYLRSGRAIVLSLGAAYDIFDESKIAGTPSIFTDGIWAWKNSIIYYLENYNLELPNEFLIHMEKNKWKVPDPVKLEGIELFGNRIL